MSLLKIFLVSYIFVNCTGADVSADTDGWYTEGGNYEPATRIKVVLTNTLDIERKDCPGVIESIRFPFTNFGPREIVVVDPNLPPRPEPTLEEWEHIKEVKNKLYPDLKFRGEGMHSMPQHFHEHLV